MYYVIFLRRRAPKSNSSTSLLSGMSIAEVSAVSGHKDWSQLKSYTRIKPEDLLEKINNVVNLN